MVRFYRACNRFITISNNWLTYVSCVFTGVFIVVPIFWSKDLLCSHDSLYIATTEPTVFCQIQGMYICAQLHIHLINKNSFIPLQDFA